MTSSNPCRDERDRVREVSLDASDCHIAEHEDNEMMWHGCPMTRSGVPPLHGIKESSGLTSPASKTTTPESCDPGVIQIEGVG